MIFNERGGVTRSVAAWTSLILMFSVIAMGAAVAQVTGSNFEIEDGNLIVDGVDPAIDWANVGEFRQADLPTGSGDDSFGQGTKEDTAVPTVVDGSIPPNKSDLKTFGVFEEENLNGKFLHLYWTRVQDPRGTTNMDFEFNQSEILSANGVTPERTAGDVLIVYELSKGGTVPLLFSFTWLDGSEGIECEASNTYPCWGDRTDLSTAGGAEGSINESFIPAAESDGLGDLDPRTFGEASIDLSLILDPTKCTAFGSAYLKSRSSDSFTAALKDFIAPLGVSITNCGSVTIRKATVPSPDVFDKSFEFTSTVAADPASDFPSPFYLKDGENQSSDLVLAGSGYTVTEIDPSPAYDLTGIDCSASDPGLVTDTNLASGTVTFNMVVGGSVDCTYTNTLQTGSLTVVKQTIGDVGTFSFSSTTLAPSSFDLTTTAVGSPGVSKPFDLLVPGTYDVSETVPDGWNLNSATCSDGSDVNAIAVGPNEDVTCTFVNEIEVGAIEIVKTRKHAANGGAGDPHADVTFTITNATNGTNVVVQTDETGKACVDNLPVSVLDGDYTVTETVPSGYVADGDTAKTATVAESTCTAGDGVTALFSNTPLTNVTVSVDSQIDGGTASTIDCGSGPTSTGANGDGSLTLTDLEPGTYTCTIVIDP